MRGAEAEPGEAHSPPRRGPSALGRKAGAAELKIVTVLLHKHREEYAKDAKAAEALLTVGFHKRPADLPAPELAAWTNVTRVVLNLHEAITRE